MQQVPGPSGAALWASKALGSPSSFPWRWKQQLSQHKSCLRFIAPACLLLFAFPLLEKQGGAAPALPALSLFPSAGQEGIKGPPALAQTPTASPALVWGSCRVPVPALFASGRLRRGRGQHQAWSWGSTDPGSCRVPSRQSSRCPCTGRTLTWGRRNPCPFPGSPSPVPWLCLSFPGVEEGGLPAGIWLWENVAAFLLTLLPWS